MAAGTTVADTLDARMLAALSRDDRDTLDEGRLRAVSLDAARRSEAAVSFTEAAGSTVVDSAAAAGKFAFGA
jgi:hypothetical protein